MKSIVRIGRFAVVGTLNALITAFVVWLMMAEVGSDYLLANILAYIVAQTNNFFWCKYWVFTSGKGQFLREVPLFLLAFGCAYLSQFSILLLLVEVFGMNEYFAQFLGLFVYGAVNFILNRRITFRRL